MKYYLFTEVKKDGRCLDEGDDNVLVSARRVSIEQLRAAWTDAGFTWNESYEIPAKDIQYHLFQWLHLTDGEERRAIELASRSRSKT
jgi:hypothetical protein